MSGTELSLIIVQLYFTVSLVISTVMGNQGLLDSNRVSVTVARKKTFSDYFS
jgi:hypothetical protein